MGRSRNLEYEFDALLVRFEELEAKFENLAAWAYDDRTLQAEPSPGPVEHVVPEDVSEPEELPGGFPLFEKVLELRADLHPVGKPSQETE